MVPASVLEHPNRIEVRTWEQRDLAVLQDRLTAYIASQRHPVPLSRHPGWLTVLERGLRQAPYCLEAFEGDKTRGILALSYVRSRLFGRFLVSLPYLNYGGVVADTESIGRLLVDRALVLADQLGARYLELRQEQPIEHPSLVVRTGAKVHMRLKLAATSEALWNQIPSKVRNQVRKGQKSNLAAVWGNAELLPEFYAIFSRNMRDLGTPVYGQALFRSVLGQFPDRAELCVVRDGPQALAAALVLHGWGVSEVPSASSLREHNNTNANMFMYWNILERAVGRGQVEFDFGRSTPESNTYRFKKQWGAESFPATWQYYVRSGEMTEMRPDNPRYQRMIRLWQRLPVGLTRLIGPPIVRGIP